MIAWARAALLLAALVLSAEGPRAAKLPSVVAEDSTPPDDGERERYILRGLNPPLDPALRGKRVERQGTGFFVSERAIVTNYHVIGGCNLITAEVGREDASPAFVRVSASDPAHDLAVLQGDIVSAAPLSFERTLNRVDASDLSVIGFPVYGLSRQIPSITSAKARPSEIAGKRPLFQFLGEVHPGHSGSPLLDEFGAVIGIVSQQVDTVATYRQSHRVVRNVAFAIPNAVTLEFLEKNRIAHRLADPRESLTPEMRMQRWGDSVVHIACWH